jgi:hypothetical protein
MFTKCLRITLINIIMLTSVGGVGLASAQDALPTGFTGSGEVMAFACPDDLVTAPDEGRNDDADDPDYPEVIESTAAMVWDENAQRLASQYGLNLLNVTWEDTGRYYGSSVGPNISDVTIQVGYHDPISEQFNLTLMPVIRYPNFSDLTGDISPDRFYLMVGNEKGEELHAISLTEYLGNFRNYLSDPDSWAGRENSLLAKRDTHVLVSAQAAFLPIPKEGKAKFNPVIFNYQSYAGDPAVLTIVATREGTSATIIDNLRDAFPSGFSWGQRLFFNQNGERASFTGERLSDFNEQNRSDSGDGPVAAGESGLNMVMIIQVPLKQRVPMLGGDDVMLESAAEPSAIMGRSDVEAAVIGHGEVEGYYTEIDDLKIERDDRFPIRVTVQFYKATSNGVVSEADMEEIAAQIKRVYEEADYVGSLVVDGESDRPTEYDGPKNQPPGWWDAFWKRFEDNVGLDQWGAIDILRSLKAFAGRLFGFED